MFILGAAFFTKFFLSALVYRAHFGNQRNMHFPFTELTDALSHTEIPFNYILSDSFWLLGNLHAKTHTEFRFIDTLTPFNYPKGHLFLTWMGADTPPWVSVLFPNQKVITHPVYSTATQKVIGGWAEYNGPLPFIAHHSATIKIRRLPSHWYKHNRCRYLSSLDQCAGVI